MNSLRALVLVVSLGAGLAVGERAAERACLASPQPVLVSRPLVFEANRGQTDESVRFLARGGRCTAFLTPTETVLPVRGGALRIRPAGANAAPQMEGVNELPGKANYFLGNDPAKWRTDVPTFTKVRARDVYPGIDVVSYGTDGRLEYDFVVAPGVDPSVIAIEFDGADRVELGADGDLALHVGGETVHQLAPVVYQDVDGARRMVEGRYVLDGPDRVRFVLGGYDAAHPLCIDPVVVYGSYLGGSSDDIARRIVRDAAGNLYVCGGTASSDFPKADVGQVASVGFGSIGQPAAFVTKLDPTGTSILFATYVGGNSSDLAFGVRVDGAGRVFVCGEASSSDFPTTPGVIQTVRGGIFDAFLLGLSPDGSALLFSTYLGGSGSDRASALAMDGAGNSYITGFCTSGFPIGHGETYQSPLGHADAYVAKINPTGTNVLYHKGLAGTVPGGDGEGLSRGDGIAVDAAGNAYVAGSTETSDFPLANAYQTTYAGGDHDAFVACVNAAGTDLIFSTLLGGSEEDVATALTLGPGGNVLITGMTYSGDLPWLNALQPSLLGSTDMFVAEFTATGTAVHVTNFGGTGNEFAQSEAGDIVVDGAGKVWITAFTGAGQLPTTVGAPMPTTQGDSDGFVARFDAALSTIEYCTYLGGLDDDYATSLVVADSGNPFVVGFTISTDFPTTSGALHTSYGGNYDAFIISPPVSLVPPPPPPPPPAIEAFFLPRRVVAKQDAKTPSNSKLIAAGFFDLGPDEPDLTKPATLEVGGFSFSIPGLALKGKRYYYAEPGMDFTVFTNPARSSRARFRVRTTGDLTGKVDLDGPLTLKFTSGDVKDAKGVVKLTAGRYMLGRIKGSLVTPSLFVQRAAANLKGAGRHSLSVIVGLAAGGTTPTAAAELTIGFGGSAAVTIPAASFVRRGDTDVFTGTVRGITKVVVNYARDQITVTGKGLDLGSYAQGGNSVLISLALGDEQRAVHVRMARTGNAMKY